MALTKEDYMNLSKERLAELLVEKDNIISIPYTPSTPYVPCYAPDGICTNPQMDCVNCPKKYNNAGKWVTSTSTNTTKNRR